MSFPGKNPRFDSTILTDIGVAVPANPAAGSHKIVDRSGALYVRSSAGSETLIGTPPFESVYNSGTWNADDTTSFATGVGGGTISGALSVDRIKYVQVSTLIVPTDMFTLQFSNDQVVWQPNSVAGVPVPIFFSGSGAVDAGATFFKFDGNTLVVTFGRYQYQNGDGSGLTNWTTGFWRLVRITF